MPNEKIGYIGLAYLGEGVQAVAVSYDQGATFVNPSIDHAKDQTYPIVRPLYYYYEVKSEAAVKPFIDYVLSDEGQATVLELGYVMVK